MAKSFKDTMQQKAVNPTMQFISQPYQAPDHAPEADAPEPTIRESKPRKAASTSRRSKSAPRPQARRALTQYGEEAKTRRLQLLLTPSLYEAVKERAAQERRSVNDFINATLLEAIIQEGDHNND